MVGGSTFHLQNSSKKEVSSIVQQITKTREKFDDGFIFCLSLGNCCVHMSVYMLYTQI